MLWKNTFQCMIPHIDAQHKALFEHIERLGTMDGDVSRIPKTVEFLEKYAGEHFADEESLHSQTRYPHALEHRRSHRDFADRIRKLRENYEASGHNLGVLMEMNRALVGWLAEHILQMDKRFAKFYKPLPDELKRSLRLPRRPWIPDSSQPFGRDAADGPKGTAAALPRPAGGSWTDAMLCGIPAIDEQHKELFRQVDILRNRGNKDRVPGVLRFLADYVVKHFNDEESLHLRSRYPKAAEHGKLHENFIRTFGELKAKYGESKDDFASVVEMNKVVYDWLKVHVLKADKEFAKYYLALPDNPGGPAAPLAHRRSGPA